MSPEIASNPTIAIDNIREYMELFTVRMTKKEMARRGNKLLEILRHKMAVIDDQEKELRELREAYVRLKQSKDELFNVHVETAARLSKVRKERGENA